jgi:hypothetical protein
VCGRLGLCGEWEGYKWFKRVYRTVKQEVSVNLLCSVRKFVRVERNEGRR